jgi:cytochrome c-type biogenesis protein CcmH
LSFWLAATAIPVVTALLLFRPLLRNGGPWLGLGLALLLLLPVTTLLLYQGVGTPSAIDVSPDTPGLAQRAGQDTDIEELLAQLEARMAAQPEDLEGWLLLGRSYRSLQRHEEALIAFQRARALAPEDPAVAVELAEALIFTSDPAQPNPDVSELLAQALASAPDLQKGLWLAGMVAAQAGDDAKAVSHWDRLMTQLEPGSPVAASVQQQLDAARARLGVAPPVNWPGLEIVVTAPAELPALNPESALFVIARNPDAPNPPLGAVRLPPAFPAIVRMTDANSMMPQRPLSGAARLQIQARLSLDGNPIAAAGDPQSEAVTIAADHSEPIELTLQSP